MQAIKGIFENGEITLYGKISPENRKARLTIVIEEEEDNDAQVDWEEYFGVVKGGGR